VCVCVSVCLSGNSRERRVNESTVEEIPNLLYFFILVLHSILRNVWMMDDAAGGREGGKNPVKP
jgi:hypothetical protein